MTELHDGIRTLASHIQMPAAERVRLEESLAERKSSARQKATKNRKR